MTGTLTAELNYSEQLIWHNSNAGDRYGFRVWTDDPAEYVSVSVAVEYPAEGWNAGYIQAGTGMRPASPAQRETLRALGLRLSEWDNGFGPRDVPRFQWRAFREVLTALGAPIPAL